ncbi:hypothetical protein [Lactobacillus crispatus]|jgi:hypothetical protein|uniref:Uncharacterized protein n=1 Tax=Lactobacillus crispatus TaxID=47770 RepID=A0AAW8WIJ0_9LACO|nr:hypothetical protein [Lactobacillus crispatus]STX18384.1 Uncharacterised protein [Lactobacillus acidophilus]MCT7731187.1 hypothetical protein [Lactobacillus crispatus]MCT7802878.1 hypothetical protein [Lactobacillus crispatus]MCT7808065.1 hypothetical protein [Lactobacillus crispatus]MCT7816701.1 hypothetical protein [Lactobacillus crispatus]
MTSKNPESIKLINQVNKDMKIAALINLSVGTITLLTSIFLTAFKALLFPAIVTLILGVFYEYRIYKLKTKAWEHLDVLVTLALINLFFGAFIPVIFILFAVKNRHKANVLLGKSYLDNSRQK